MSPAPLMYSIDNKEVVTDADVLVVVTKNYAIYHDVKEQLTNLQEWIRLRYAR